MPQATSLSHNSANIRCGSVSGWAPSISQATIVLVVHRAIGVQLIAAIFRDILPLDAPARGRTWRLR
jgi:hypothetical protein